jgi:hypothetical protein
MISLIRLQNSLFLECTPGNGQQRTGILTNAGQAFKEKGYVQLPSFHNRVQARLIRVGVSLTADRAMSTLDSAGPKTPSSGFRS